MFSSIGTINTKGIAHIQHLLLLFADVPCGNNCPTRYDTGFFDFYLHCDGTCTQTDEDRLGFSFKSGKIVEHKYKRLCDGVCQDASTPCHEKCLNIDKFSFLNCKGSCSDEQTPAGKVLN